MKKKEYKEPKMRVVELESSAILVGSNDFNNGVQSLSDDDDYVREDVIFD